MIAPFRRTGRHALAALLAAALVAACGSPPAATITVEGVVRGPMLGPLAGVIVHVAGRTTTTDAVGAFRVDGVTVPYDVTLAGASPSPWVATYQGLVGPTPTFEPRGVLAPGFEATVTGDIFGGNPLPPLTRAVVCVEGATSRAFGCDFVVGGETTYEVQAGWFGGFAIPVHVNFLWMVVDDAGVPISVPVAWRHDTTLTHGGTITFHPSETFPIANVSLAVSAAVAGGGIPYAVAVASHLDDEFSMPVHFGLALASDFTVALPELAAGRYEALMSAKFGEAESWAWDVTDDAAAGVGLLIPAPPQLLGPSDGAEVTSATEFVSVGGPGVARTFTWRPTGGTDGPIVQLTAARDRVTMPDLSVVGMAWTAGGSYAWSVSAGAHATVEEAAAEAAVPWYYLVLAGMGHVADGCHTETAERAVTLAP